jgi:hypothetical protein
VYNKLQLNNIGFSFVLKRNVVAEDIRQPALAAIMHLAEGLALAQCRASSVEWSLNICASTRRLMALRMEQQLILLLKTLISDKALRCRCLNRSSDTFNLAKI